MDRDRRLGNDLRMNRLRWKESLNGKRCADRVVTISQPRDPRGCEFVNDLFGKRGRLTRRGIGPFFNGEHGSLA